ncbi:MAG: trypsin-like serine protease [Ilumatobacteraceae bacterium]
MSPNHPHPRTGAVADRSPRRAARLFAGASAVVAATAATVALAAPDPAAAIVDGEPTSIADAPWQVSLQDANGHFCGGSVIDATTVLTAAHCVEGNSAADLFVRAGVTDRTDPTGQDRPVASIVVHPGGFDAANDVALVRLASPLVLGGTVQAIAVAGAADVAAASTGSVSGWGATAEDDGFGSDVLLSAEVPLVDDATCAVQLGPDGGLTAATELCAEGVGAGSCYGDSGGPLTIVAPDGTVKLAGVVSWGVECAVLPGVFAEVPVFAPWIADGGAGSVPVDGAGTGADQGDPWTEDGSSEDGGWYEDEDGGWYEDEDGGWYEDEDGGWYEDEDGGWYEDEDGGWYEDEDGGWYEDEDGGWYEDEDGGWYEDEDGGWYEDEDGGWYEDEDGGWYEDEDDGGWGAWYECEDEAV